MPKLYIYFGIVIYFYSKEHEPVHVHAQKDGRESKAEFHIMEGIVREIQIKNVRGRKPLADKDMAKFAEVLEHHKDDIVQKWMDYFVLRKDISCENITRRLK